MPGILYIVATPIGNLKDVTYRAVATLRQVDTIACEDTRRTGKLLGHYGIQTPARSFHEHNEERQTTELIERLRSGRSVALVSDAGMPLISDPGYRLVAAAAAEGVPIVPIPGASAVVTALAASGLPTDSFRFCGFLPNKPNSRRSALEALRSETATLVLFEAPHRILESLSDIGAILGERPMALAREMTKMHEEFLRGTPAQLREILAGRGSLQGEMTLVVGWQAPQTEKPSDSEIHGMVEALVCSGKPRMEAMKQTARRLGLSKREVYAIAGRGGE